MTHELVDATLTVDATAWGRNTVDRIKEIQLKRK